MLILFGVILELPLEIDLPPIERILMLFERDQSGQVDSFRIGLMLLLHIFGWIEQGLHLISWVMLLATLPISFALR